MNLTPDWLAALKEDLKTNGLTVVSINHLEDLYMRINHCNSENINLHAENLRLEAKIRTIKKQRGIR